MTHEQEIGFFSPFRVFYLFKRCVLFQYERLGMIKTFSTAFEITSASSSYDKWNTSIVVLATLYGKMTDFFQCLANKIYYVI